MTTARQFVHLHNHSSYSTRDGLQKIGPMCDAAAADNQPAIAVTDHGVLGATRSLGTEAAKRGIKPIMGIEAYLAIGDRRDPSTLTIESKTFRYHHLTLLARTATGWRNLLAMQAAAASESMRGGHPMIDLPLLADHAEGLVILSGCMSGPVLGPLVHGDAELARSNLATLADIAGPGNLFVEMMDHGIPIERRVLPELAAMARAAGLPLVATNDAHYTSCDDHEAHDAWLCTGQDGHTLSTPNRWHFNGTGYHLRTAAEMAQVFSDLDPSGEALANTLLIAEGADADVIGASVGALPTFTQADGSPLGMSSDEWLYNEVRSGAVARFGSPLTPEVKARLRTELDVIADAGFADYFLIVADMIAWARSQGIRVGPGRGSAAGSLVAYCLRITDIDPMPNHLLFERFLSPTRKEMPDIDTDFETGRRGEVMAYLARRWGRDHVARIGTYAMAQAAEAIRTTARLMEKRDVGNRIAPTVPTGSGGKVMSFDEILDPKNDAGSALRNVLTSSGDARKIVDLARSFEGVVNASSIHACGVVVSATPLPEAIPLRVEKDKDTGEPVVVTEWTGKEVADAGFLKLDVLGLRNLDIITKALRIIEASTGEAADVDAIPEGDDRWAAAWRLIAAGDTDGVFQLESSGMKRLCSQIAPTQIGELAAIIALYRPGPMSAKMHEVYAHRKTGAAEVDYGVFSSSADEVAAIDSVFGETFGVPVYQEQIMRLSEVVAGFSPDQRNKLQKAISKKDREQMEVLHRLFCAGATSERTTDGAPKLAFRQETAEKLWESFQGAADYAFNKSHALGYAVLAFQTAWLKANWPAAFGAATLAATKLESKRVALIRSLRDSGVSVLHPDVNLGEADTSLDPNGAVRIGLAEVKGARGEAVAALVAERQRGGPFTSFHELVSRVQVTEPDGKKRFMDSGTLDAIIEAGACDSFGPRMGLVAVARVMRDVEPTYPIPDMEWGVVELSIRERARLGIQVSPSPLTALRDEIAAWRADRPGTLPVDRVTMDARSVATLGVVADFAIVKKGKRRATLTVEGTRASIDCTIWSDGLAELESAGSIPVPGQIVWVSGRPNVWTSQHVVADDDDPDGEPTVEVVEHRALSVNKVRILEIGLEPTYNLVRSPLPFALPDPELV